MQEEHRKEKGLKKITVSLMIITAIFFDVLQWILAFVFMDWLVSIFAYLTFFLWFAIHGIYLWKPKRLLTAAVTSLAEVLPMVAVLPVLTVGVTIIALDAKLKDAVGTVASKVPGGRMAAGAIPGGKSGAVRLNPQEG